MMVVVVVVATYVAGTAMLAPRVVGGRLVVVTSVL